jgi:phage gp36-like protein
MAVETLLKQPAEVVKRQPVFGLSAAASTVQASVVARGLVAGAAAMVATPTIAAGVVSVSLSGGTDGERYLVTVTVTATTGEVAQAELDVAVIDGAWAMPDGGTGYLSITEFVDRVGLPEVIAITDGVGDGRIDRAMLISRLTDAQSLVDTHFAGRYLVPLVSPPQIVKKLVADLAQAALYPRGAPDGIAEQAKQSIRLLERIQAGQVQIPSAVPPAPAVSENPILISPGRRAYPDGLLDYP